MHGSSDHHIAQLWPKLPWSVAVGQQRFPISLVSEIPMSCLTITPRTGDSPSFVSPESQVYILSYFISIFWLGLFREIRNQDWGCFRENELSHTGSLCKAELVAESSIWDILAPTYYVGVGVQSCPARKGHNGSLFSEIREKCCQVVSTTPMPLCRVQAPASHLLCQRGWMRLLSELQSCIHHD